MIIALSAALILLAQADPADDPAANVEALKQLYAQSCGSRGYAAYDDVCEQITRQLREAEAQVRRQHRPTKAPAAAPTPQQPVAPAAAASNGTTPK